MEAKFSLCLMLIISGALTAQGAVPRNKKNPLEVFARQPGRKLHLEKPNKLLLELPKDISQRAVQDSFSQRLFNGILSWLIRFSAISTVFMQGMASVKLNANYYGAYMVQDIAYLHNAVNAFNRAAEIMQEQGEIEFEEFYRNESSVWESDYLAPMLIDWHLENTENIQPGTAAGQYMSFVTTVSQDHAKYLAIALLPCTMLWRWMADVLIDSVPENSAYYSWFEENKSSYPGYKGGLEKFVDENFSFEEDYQKAERVFCQGMVSELNFFRESGKQSIFPVPPQCQLTGSQ